MAELAKSNPAIAARHDLFIHRVPEEFYEVARDPDCLRNLIAEAPHQERLLDCRSRLEAWMVDAGDPMLDVFRKRDDPAAREAFMASQEAETNARKADKKGKGGGKKKGGKKGADAPGKAGARKASGLIAFALPEVIEAGKSTTIGINHHLPEDMGEQVLTVTLKTGNQRLDRKTVTAKGDGTAQVVFDIPPGLDETVNFAAFVGDDYQKTPQHIATEPLPVKEP